MKDLTWYAFRIFMVALLPAALAFGQPATCSYGPVPFTCSQYIEGFSLLVSYWGYLNPCSAPVTIPIGSSNFFFPGYPNLQQPTVFQPGIHVRAHVTAINLSPYLPDLTWFLGSSNATAKNDPTTYCDKHDTLIFKGPWSATTLYFTNDVVNYNGSRWLARKYDFAPPQADTLAIVGSNLGITPVEGDYWTMLEGQGPQGPAGLQGMQGIQGPPGPSGPSGVASITTVTVPTTTVTATASCSANQVLISGGGTCTVPNINSISGRIASSGPSANNSWTVICSAGQATAVALCAAK